MTNVEYTGPSKLLDNEQQFIEELLVLLLYSDPDYKVKIYKKPEEIMVHITPSDEKFRQDIISNLLYFNRSKITHIKFSSSLAISRTVSFSIPCLNGNESISLNN